VCESKVNFVWKNLVEIWQMNYDKIITKYDMKLKNDKIDWNMTNELSKNKIDEVNS